MKRRFYWITLLMIGIIFAFGCTEVREYEDKADINHAVYTENETFSNEPIESEAENKAVTYAEDESLSDKPMKGLTEKESLL